MAATKTGARTKAKRFVRRSILDDLKRSGD